MLPSQLTTSRRLEVGQQYYWRNEGPGGWFLGSVCKGQIGGDPNSDIVSLKDVTVCFDRGKTWTTLHAGGHGMPRSSAVKTLTTDLQAILRERDALYGVEANEPPCRLSELKCKAD